MMGGLPPSEVLSHNTAIAERVSSLTGESAVAACNGFRNLGDCVSAAHVARNLGIPFDGPNSLKSLTTGSNRVSLGKAIQDLRPNANKKSELKRAKRQTSTDLKGMGS